MGLSEQGKEHKNSTAASLGRLSIGVLTVSLVTDIQWLIIVLIIFGVILAIGGIYLIILANPKQEKWFSGNVTTKKSICILEALGWLIILSLFGLRLIQTGTMWLKIVGISFAIFAYVVFCVSIRRARQIKD